MLINEAAKRCSITKKAVQYYAEQGLVVPAVLENGYKDFSEDDIRIIRKIVLYRKLGLTISEIKKVLIKPDEVKSVFYQRTLELEREKVKQELLKRLAEGQLIEDLEQEINGINSKSVIIRKLMELFPSYYGKFISLNFARYLTGQMETEEQMKAFEEIIEFFDNVPEMEIPADLQEYLDQYFANFSSEEGIDTINGILQSKHDAIQNIEEFVNNNKVILDEYNRYKQTEEYRNSPAYRLKELMMQFCSSNGYYDVFIPAMRRLSPLYNKYYEQMLKADEEFIKRYPEYVL